MIMKFNLLSRNKYRILNYEGETAFKLSPEMELYSTVVTWSLNDSFYEKDEARLQRLRGLMSECDPVFIGKLAVYTRTIMHMRSAPLVLVTELAKMHSGDDLVSKVTDGVIRRADEITELLACYALLNERQGSKTLNRLSKQIQKGLTLAFNRFDEYQFAKYNRDGAIKLRDALFLVHPKAKDEVQQGLFNKIVDNKLEVPYTWETELSALGQFNFDSRETRAAAFRAKWEELVDSGKLGYMALLRNLRNLLSAGVSYSHLVEVCRTLSDPQRVAHSKQFPFRYLAAYRELFNSGSANKGASSGYYGEIMDALEHAAIASAANIRGFDENTRVLLACDVSGSMQTPISERSKVQLYDIGLTLAMALQSRCKNVEVGMFGDTWKMIRVPRSRILSNVMEFHHREGEVGYSTNGYLVLKDILDRKVKVDKVMMFTDGILWNTNKDGAQLKTLWAKYKAKVSPTAKMYLFDLKGYGQSPIELVRSDVYLIAGWSDKVFDVLAALEDGSSALEMIKNIEL